MKKKSYKKWKKTVTLIAIDNGVSGAVALRSPYFLDFFPTPVYNDLEYTKKQQFLNRLDQPLFYQPLALACSQAATVYILLERPMINFRRFKQSMSAIRCLEAQLTVLQQLEKEYGNIFYRYIDSKEWQGAMIPRASGEGLKDASTALAIKHFPEFHPQLMKSDGDAPVMLLYMMERTKWFAKEPWRIPGQKKKVIPYDFRK